RFRNDVIWPTSTPEKFDGEVTPVCKGASTCESLGSSQQQKIEGSEILGTENNKDPGLNTVEKESSERKHSHSQTNLALLEKPLATQKRAAPTSTPLSSSKEFTNTSLENKSK